MASTPQVVAVVIEVPPTLFDELLVVIQLKPTAQGSEIVQSPEHLGAFRSCRAVRTPQNANRKLVHGVQQPLARFAIRPPIVDELATPAVRRSLHKRRIGHSCVRRRAVRASAQPNSGSTGGVTLRSERFAAMSVHLIFPTSGHRHANMAPTGTHDSAEILDAQTWSNQ